MREKSSRKYLQKKELQDAKRKESQRKFTWGS